MHAESFHAVALSASRRIVALRSQFPLVSEDADTTWVHCAKEGTWKGHPQGAITFTKKIFEQIKKNFERQTNAIPVRFEHPDYLPNGQPILTAGYIHKFEVRPTGLYAWVEFTPDGAKTVRTHHYKSCSLVVIFDSKDRVTNDDIGAEVLELGLTNIPFIDGLDPIKLSRAFAEQARRYAMGKKLAKDEKMDVDALVKEAKRRAGEDADPRKFLDVMQALVEFEEKMNGTGGDPEAPAEEAVDGSMLADPPDEDAVELSEAQPQELAEPADEATTALALEALTILEQALGLDGAGAVQWLRENAGTLKGGNVGSTADSAFSRLSVAQSRIKALTKQRDEAVTKLSKLEADAKAKREEDEQKAAEQKVDALIESGDLLDAERDHAVKLARKDGQWFDEWMKARGPVVPTGQVTADGPKKLGRKGASSSTGKGDDADLEPRDDIERAIVELNAGRSDRASVLARHRAKAARAH